MTWDDFEQHLVSVGWTEQAAHQERLQQEHGPEGDPDGGTSMTFTVKKGGQ